MTRAETYQDYAAECLAIASRLPEGIDRQFLIEMAVRWYELAQVLSSFMTEQDDPELERSPRSPDLRR